MKTINSTDNPIALDRVIVNIFGYPVSLRICYLVAELCVTLL